MRRATPWAALALLALACPALAQEVPSRGLLSGPADAGTRARPNPKPSGDEPLGFRAGDVMIYPSLFTGFTFDDNVYARASGGVSGVAFRVAPTIVATLGPGSRHGFTAYATADARSYLGRPRADAVDAGAGVLGTVEVERGLVIRLQADYLHADEGSGAADGLFGAVPLRGSLIETVPYDGGYAAASVTKTFNRLYVSLGGSVLGQAYDREHGGATVYRDGLVGTVSGRVGYRVTPFLSAYVETTGTLRDDEGRAFDGHGLRVVAGLASECIGLFHGEAYAGYAHRGFDAGTFADVDGAVFGARLVYEPTRLLTLALSADRNLDGAGIGGPGLQTGAAYGAAGATRGTTVVALRGDYRLLRSLTLNARLGYEHAGFLGGGSAEVLRAGGGASYRINRNLSVVVDATHDRASSRLAGRDYVRSRVTAGVTSRF